MDKLKEQEQLEIENLKIRNKIQKLLTELTDQQRNEFWDLAVDLIENELNQERLCNE